MNDIKKINALQFYKGNPSKTQQTQKIKYRKIFAKRPRKFGEIWRSTFSMMWKKFYLEGVFEFLHSAPNLGKILYPQIFVDNFHIFGYSV